MNDEAGQFDVTTRPGAPLDIVTLSPWAIPRSITAAAPKPTAPIPAVLHLLVVDEIAMNRDIAASFLRAAGHKVTCVEGGAEAIAAVKTTNFNVVLMDVRMPEMDGLEATRHIRALERARAHERERGSTYGTGSHRVHGPEGRCEHVPIVALTARTFTEQVAQCREAGMDSHVPKPFTQDTLLTAVLRAAAAGPAQDPVVREPGPATPQVAPTVSAAIARQRVLDHATFDRTACFLPPESVDTYVRTIAKRAKDLLQELRGPAAPLNGSNELAEAAHTIAGIAGMFGFERLTYLGCRLERAIESRAPEAPALAQSLRAALEDTLNVIHNRSPAAVEPGISTAGRSSQAAEREN
jgi:CheY-like chemotaxis protein